MVNLCYVRGTQTHNHCTFIDNVDEMITTIYENRNINITL